MAGDIVFQLSPTQSDFVHSTAHINHLTGPMGEGKTHCAVARIIAHAYRCKLRVPLRAAIIRDTHVNIKTSTAVSITEILGDRAVFKDDYKKLYIKAQYPIECDLFGIDDEASISKLQGPQYGTIWLEEPAPIYEKANAGLPFEVFSLAISRCGRQAGTIPNLQITQNPGDEEHWTSKLIDEPEDFMVASNGTVITKKTFHIQKGENTFLSAVQRAMNMAAFKNDPAKWARYVEGKTASVIRGKAVTPNYNPDLHFSQHIQPLFPKLAAFRFWDGYQHPSCIVAQWNPFGQLVLHDCLTHENHGVVELIDEKYRPLMETPKYRDKYKDLIWRDIGDPSMADPDQSSRAVTASRRIQQMLNTHFELGPVRWQPRIQPLTNALTRLVGNGRPLVLISASAAPIHRALKGGWHYKMDNNGNRIGDMPVKNEYDHIGMALAYGTAIVLPYNAQALSPKKNKTFAEKLARMNRAASYGSGTGPFGQTAGRM